MLQNATPIRKSIPWPPNISHEHVSCTVLATRHASLWIFFKCHTPAIVFWISLQKNLLVLLTFGRVRNPLRLPRESTSERPKVVRDRDRHFLTLLTSKCASRHNGVHFFDISTSKSIRRLKCFVHVDFDMCFAPQRRALFRHLNFQTCSEAEVLCACWLRNVLRATTACTFSTSQFPKVFRGWSALYILTSKCASRHNGVPLFNIATSESGPNPAVFNPWLRNVLGATTACNFSSLIWPDGSAPAALASLLFDPPEPQILWKTQWIATFLPFRAPASSFFWLFLFSDLLSSSLLFSALLFSDSSHLCFSICPYCPYLYQGKKREKTLSPFSRELFFLKQDTRRRHK